MKLSRFTFHEGLSAALLVTATALASWPMFTNGTGPSEPISVAPEVFEFGKIHRGELTGEFELTNQSDKAIEISYVITACSCQTAKVTRKQVQPGETTTALFNWDANAEMGISESYFRVFYEVEGEEKPRYALCRFTGDIIPPFSFEPQEFSLALDASGVQTAVVKFSSVGDRDCHVIQAACEHAALSVECDAEKNVVMLTFDPTLWHDSDYDFEHTVDVTTACSPDGVCSIPVRFSSR